MSFLSTIRETARLLLRPTGGPWSHQITWSLLRIVAGTVMIHNGLDKLSNIESFAQAYVSVIGLPFPIFFSYVAAYTELIGAPLLILGLLTRPAALGLFATMVVAMYHHIKVAGLSIPYLELSALYAACFLGFAVNGSGLLGIDALLAGWLLGGSPQVLEPIEPITTSPARRTSKSSIGSAVAPPAQRN